MKDFLTPSDKEDLRKQHRQADNRRIADRIKAVLLADKGWTYRQIAEALLLDEQTVGNHVDEYKEKHKLTLNYSGSKGKLNTKQMEELVSHLETNLYLKVSDICFYVLSKYAINYTVAGMTSWLRQHGFTYKKPKNTPAKLNPEKQQQFVEYYEKLKQDTPADEPILFGDGVHPTMATKITFGWIKKGVDKPIATNASRTRVNLFGTINLKTMNLLVQKYETIDTTSMLQYFDELKIHYPDAKKIHLILDQGPYNISKNTRKGAEERGIILHHLPPYSPNLNPIERVWKVMNEHTRNNCFFKSAKDFRQKISDFFDSTWSTISDSMRTRVTDNFQKMDPMVSF